MTKPIWRAIPGAWPEEEPDSYVRCGRCGAIVHEDDKRLHETSHGAFDALRAKLHVDRMVGGWDD